MRSQKANAERVLEGDIQSCFDNISHDWMIANIPMDKAILQEWLKAGYVYQNELFPAMPPPCWEASYPRCGPT